MLTTSINNNGFNCYSSTALLADVMLRLGKSVTFIMVPEHILLSGNTWIFETTKRTGAAFPRKEIGLKQHYPMRQEGGVDLLFSTTCNMCACRLIDCGETDRAITYYDAAIKSNACHEAAWYNRGYAYYLNEEFDKAISDFTVAIGLDKNHADAWFNRGNAHLKSGALDKAIADYDTAIMLDKSIEEAWNNRGCAYRMKGELSRAQADYVIALSLKLNAATNKQ